MNKLYHVKNQKLKDKKVKDLLELNLKMSKLIKTKKEKLLF